MKGCLPLVTCYQTGIFRRHKLDKKNYTERIQKAGPVGLVALNFEITLDFLREARKMYKTDIEASRHAVTRAKEGYENLIQSLDFDVGLSFDFYELYRYVYGILSEIHPSKNEKKIHKTLEEAIEITEKLGKVWRELSDKTPEEPAPDDEPKIYTGLTYGRDGKATEYIDVKKRGLQA